MNTRKDLVAVARGDRPADLVIQNVQLVNVLTRTIDGPVDIGLFGDRIAFVVPVGTAPHGVNNLDGTGMFASPGFCDGHVHNESSMCTPAQWARTIVPLGTTTVFTDPHEIGNVMGIPGIEYMLAASEGIPLRYNVTASSCIPSVPGRETAGAEFRAAEARHLLEMPRVVAIAEAMDFMGLIGQGGFITEIVEVGHQFGVPIEGHAPGIVDRLLQAYLAAAGPRASDHESWTAVEMLQKVLYGMMVYARDSTFMDTVPEVAKALRSVNDTRMFGFCTDDIFAHHLLDHGHLDRGIRNLIRQGIDPVIAYQMASLNVASHYGIHGLGAIAPGWYADILLIDNLEEVGVQHVIQNGRHVVQDGEWIVAIEEPVPPLLENTVHIPTLSIDNFRLGVDLPDGRVRINAIDMSELLTRGIVLEVSVNNGFVELADGQTMAAIVPRHGQNTPPSLAVLSGYKLRRGSVASTVSHDSHNMAIIGTNPSDMLVAAQHLAEIGGGLVAVVDGLVIAEVPFPIAGLMSPLPVPEIAEQVRAFEAAMPQLGLPPAFPVHLIALALPVFPEVRLTDMGAVNVATQEFIPLLAE